MAQSTLRAKRRRVADAAGAARRLARGGRAPRRGRWCRRWRRPRGWRAARGAGAEAEARLGEEAVLLAGVAGPARRDDVVPGVRAAAGAGHHVVDVLGRPVAVLAAVAVAGEDGPARERHPVAVRHPHEVVEPDHRRHRAASTRSECSSAPLRATISAFSFSTSTTARRIGTTQSGSKLALSSRALPKRRDLHGRRSTAASLPATVRRSRRRVAACPGTTRGRRRGRAGSGAPSRAVLGLEAEARGSRGRAAGGTAGAATTAAGRGGAPGASAVGHSDGRASTSTAARAPERRRRATPSGRLVRHAAHGTRPARPGAGAPETLWYRRDARSGGVRGSARHRAEPRLVVRPPVLRAARQRRARDPGQARAGPPRARVPPRRGPPPHRGRPRRRQDVAGQGDRGARSAAPATASSSPPTSCPSDVTGVSVWNRAADEFEFRPGGVFANVVLADEINRASPKTQSALLEAMEERQVTVDAHTYRAAAPVHGDRDPEPDRARGHLSPARGAARPLPHAHPDGLPDRDAELAILEAQGERAATVDDARRPVVERRRRRRRRARWSARVHVAPELRDYIVDLVAATRRHPDLVLGASPRGSLALQRAARALAASFGRDYVIPDDVKRVAPRGARAPPARSRPTRSCAASRADDVVALDPRVGAGAGRDRRAEHSRRGMRPPPASTRAVTLTRRGWSLIGARVRPRRRELPARHASRCSCSGSPRSCCVVAVALLAAVPGPARRSR